MRTLLTFALIAFVAASATACRRGSGVSPEYAEASGLHDRLRLSQGDEAYADPQMDQVESLLKQVPADSSDAQAAKELLAQIANERARIAEEAAAAAAIPAQPPEPVFEEDDEDEEEPAAAPEVPDAGYSQPAVGMTLAEFQSRFSRCFQAGPELMLSGVGMRQTFQLRDNANCRDLHPDFVTLLLVVEEGKIAGMAKQSATSLRLPDGGVPRQPQDQPAQESGQPAQPSPQPAPDDGSIRY
ncbi:MAG: hypothetical protein M3Y59_11475 [Myxococcota bacterium]|nr:hypothetical protein [Myxococcota bacterium]